MRGLTSLTMFPVLFVSVLFGICLGDSQDGHSTEPTHLLSCPGKCIEKEICSTAMNDTDCPEDTVCCVDSMEASTDFADWGFTTEDGQSYSTTEDPVSSTTYTYVEAPHDNEPEDPNYTYVYSEDPDADQLNEVDRQGFVEDEECPGSCVSVESASGCNYILDSDSVCPAGEACCLSEDHVQEIQQIEEDPEEIGDANIVKRAANFPMDCPGTCVHPSHALFCEEVQSQFFCPLDSKCCVKRSVTRNMAPPSQIVECAGQCLPLNMHGYCFPPNELVLGNTNCKQGTMCCMRRQSGSAVPPPSVNRMKFPSLPIKPSAASDQAQVVLGHLAIDDAGTVYKVNTNGQIFPLRRLNPQDHMMTKYTRLTAYPRFDGEVAIYADPQGNMFQQFFPRKQTSPLVRQPIYQFESPASEHEASFPEPYEGEQSDALEDVVIPDDDDEPPVSVNTPVMRDTKGTNPPCPGSCMSYFLRFTCFSGYAIYDGFSCPGRSVCCARLKDIEEHEQYLKSLSPYFNTPPTNKDSQLPRCGVKGRRDTPRVMGGKESLPGEWCWQVAIINTQNQYICGGAIIDNSWIVTAAHCVVGPMRENQAIFIRAGVTDLKSMDENNNGQTIRVLSTFVHHNFNSLNLDNNIALLRLQRPLELGSNVCVVCLPTSGKMPKDVKKCTVTGYGFVSADGDMSLKIREAQVPIIDDTDCMTNVTEALTNPFILPASSFCAGGHGQQDACQGDSGGPLVCEVAGFHELVGVVSWSLGCGRSDVPSIYVKVPAFMGWINQIISSSSFLMSLE